MTDAPGRGTLRCRDIMTADVNTATGDMPIAEVAVLMRDTDVGSLPVVEGGKLAGIVTDRDIVVRAIAEGRGADTPVKEAMTTELFSVGPDDPVFQAIRIMGERQVRRIPVVNADGSLAGIIAMADVVLQTEDDREIAETLEEISSGSAFWGSR